MADHTISTQDVEHIAQLARLQLDASEVQRLRHDLSCILDYVSQLNELDTAEVTPTAHPSAAHSVVREDQPEIWNPPHDPLELAAQRDGPFFVVPRILDPGAGGTV